MVERLTTETSPERVEAPRELLADFLKKRRELGQDRHDEVWEGVYHVVPGPTGHHQRMEAELLILLAPLAKARQLWYAGELDLRRPGTGERDYRQPDLIFCKPFEGDYPTTAELVIEVLSPGDDSRKKLPFYADLGVREALLIEPTTRTPEMLVNRGGVMKPLEGQARSEVLGVTFSHVDGKLRLSWDGGSTDI